jgi:hypothetical protein
MPVHKIPGGYQYGETGKKYYGKDAKKKAELQARAIEANRHRDDEDEDVSRSNKIAIGKKFMERYTNPKKFQGENQ